MSKTAFVSDSLGVAVAASEQLIPRLAMEYTQEERLKNDMRKIRGIGGSRECLRVTPLCLGYIHLHNKVLQKKKRSSDLEFLFNRNVILSEICHDA